jgi:hypothetical protein
LGGTHPNGMFQRFSGSHISDRHTNPASVERRCGIVETRVKLIHTIFKSTSRANEVTRKEA